MASKWNQFRQARMRDAKPDTEKLVELGRLLSDHYYVVVHREPICLFDGANLVAAKICITEAEFRRYVIHVPDMLVYAGDRKIFIEVDGWIHETNSKVARKDVGRNALYEAADLDFIVLNERQVLEGLGVAAQRPATPAELWPSLRDRMDDIRVQKKF